MTAQAILNLYRERGHWIYEGEGVSQLVHAWQCAQLAKAAHAKSSLILAAWLHDLGHIVDATASATPSLQGIDDAHESTGAAAALAAFGASVSHPIRWHVAAKRYLVATQPNYAARLSIDSIRSLALQGGAFTPVQCTDFIQQPFAQDALKLRVWDDAAKNPAWLPESAASALAELCGLLKQTGALSSGFTATSADHALAAINQQ